MNPPPQKKKKKNYFLVDLLGVFLCANSDLKYGNEYLQKPYFNCYFLSKVVTIVNDKSHSNYFLRL